MTAVYLIIIVGLLASNAMSYFELERVMKINQQLIEKQKKMDKARYGEKLYQIGLEE